MSAASQRARGERGALVLASAAQFVVILDFALILPLGPDLVAPLAVPASSLGLLLAAYTAAAVLSGLLASRILDRFDRRRGLFVTLLGLGPSAFAASLAPSFAALVLARALAGACGAPTSALLMSLITDEVPALRRGRALVAISVRFSSRFFHVQDIFLDQENFLVQDNFEAEA
jgi:predicted MFS family arabinose efflux permease